MMREGKNTAIFVGFEDLEQSEMATPEKNLLRAILLNAVADVNRPGEYSRKAKDYFLSKEDDYVFSFQSVCTFLNVNPHHILVLVGLEKSDRYHLNNETPQPEATESVEVSANPPVTPS